MTKKITLIGVSDSCSTLIASGDVAITFGSSIEMLLDDHPEQCQNIEQLGNGAKVAIAIHADGLTEVLASRVEDVKCIYIEDMDSVAE